MTLIRFAKTRIYTDFTRIFVISTEEKSSREARQRLAIIWHADDTDSLCKNADLHGFWSHFCHFERREKSSREARQRWNFHSGVTCGDFSFFEMTKRSEFFVLTNPFTIKNLESFYFRGFSEN